MMLSTISHSMPPVYAPSPAPPPNMTTSLPIIPPRAPLSQRPKLSVNTSQPRSFGKGASLRLDTLSAVSPTKINTFSNAYPSLDRPSKPRLSIDSNLPNASDPAALAAAAAAAAAAASTTPSSASTLSSALTSASHDATSPCIPYKQPHNLASILSNSALVPRKMASSRPMFPAEKRVSFRTPLVEEITTVKYTLAHSDLDSSVSTLASIASNASSSSSQSDSSSAMHHSLVSAAPSHSASSPLPNPSPSAQATSSFATLESSPRPKAPRTGDKRDSSSSEDESDTCPETPVAGRRKRTRDWRWTLGPLPGSNISTSPTTSEANSVGGDSS